MSERELLDLLAQDAPVARPGLADDVINRARHTRLRRGAVSGACAAVALIAAVPLALAVDRSPHPAHRTSPGGTTNSSAGTTTVAPGPSDAALAYAAGVQYLAGQLVSGKHWRVLYVIDHTCANTVDQTEACRPQPIPIELQRDLATALRPYAPVHFVSGDATIRDKNLQVINGGAAVTLGRITLDGDTARLPLAVQCGGLCGMGQTLLLAKQGGVWTVTGSTGPAWIS
jgi:hypothetical protein